MSTPPRLDPDLKAVFRSPGPPAGAAFRFSPDGKSLAFVVEEGGQDNIRMQPVDGSQGRKVTHFKDPEKIQDFRWSPDGKTLALLRFSSVSECYCLARHRQQFEGCSVMCRVEGTKAIPQKEFQ